MPVEVLPGPWSFLATLGQGVANYEEGKAKNRAEAMKQVGTIFDAVQNNQLTASTLKSPFFMDLLKRSGISDQFALSPGDVAAKPSDQLAAGQSEALGQVLPQILDPNNTTDEARQARSSLASTGKAPTLQETAEGTEKTLAANAKTQTIRGGGAAGRAQAGVIAPDVAQAAETAASEPLYNTIAGRTVDAAITNLKIPRIDQQNIQTISDAAWKLAQTDAASKGFTLNEEITKPYIDSVIQQRLRQQEEADTKRIAAQNSGAGQDPKQFLLNFYQRQQQRVVDAINTLTKPTLSQSALGGEVFRIANEQGRTVDDVMRDPTVDQTLKDAYTVTQDYRVQYPSLQKELQGYRDQIGQLLGRSLDLEQPYAPPPSSSTRGASGQPTAGPPSTTAGAGQAPPATGNTRPTAEMYRQASARLQQLRQQNNALPENRRLSDNELITQVNREFGMQLSPGGGSR